jgi:uncharacterized membrane protein YqhA
MSKIVEKSRYLAIIGVVGLLVTDVAVFCWGFFSTGMAIISIINSAGKSPDTIVDIIKVVDIFLVATTLLIFAASLYELFITGINVPDWMIAHNLHELKAKLSSMIILLMAGKFLEELFSLKDAYELMLIGIGIAVVSAVLIAFEHFGGKD